jgi:hypothetical protein
MPKDRRTATFGFFMMIGDEGDIMVWLIKFVHSVILIYMSVCIGLLWYSAFSRKSGWWLWIALASLTLEIIVFFGNGLRCPLTDWAIALGDKSGNDLLSEWFFPDWLIRYFSPICGVLLVGGLLALLLRGAKIRRFHVFSSYNTDKLQ